MYNTKCDTRRLGVMLPCIMYMVIDLGHFTVVGKIVIFATFPLYSDNLQVANYHEVQDLSPTSYQKIGLLVNHFMVLMII